MIENVQFFISRGQWTTICPLTHSEITGRSQWFFKYNFLNIFIAKTMLYILMKFIQWTFSKIISIVICVAVQGIPLCPYL